LIKLARFRAWRATIRSQGLPQPIEMLALPLVPVAEVAVPVLALSGRTKQSAVLAAALLIVFSAAVVRGRFRLGGKIPCGCFGKREVRDYRTLILRNMALGMTAAIVLTEKPGKHLLAGLRGPHLSEAVPAVLVILGLAFGVSVIVQILSLGRFLDAAEPRSYPDGKPPVRGRRSTFMGSPQ
jgi:hypothetical protein